MSSASFNSILALFCRIFKYKFGMNNKVVIKLSCVIGIKDINQSNRHYNAYWRGPNIENFEKKFYRQCKLAGPQHREFRKEILQTMQVGEGQQI
ncbi:nitrogen fixation protein NifR [Staphylococcus aureus]|nr:nitrogen fixation protein NifR [Staphylococcus aureus]